MKIKTKSIIIALFLSYCLLFCGCGKQQDIKIIHNYWDKTTEFIGRKKQAFLDMFTYKQYKNMKNTDKDVKENTYFFLCKPDEK